MILNAEIASGGVKPFESLATGLSIFPIVTMILFLQIASDGSVRGTGAPLQGRAESGLLVNMVIMLVFDVFLYFGLCLVCDYIWDHPLCTSQRDANPHKDHKGLILQDMRKHFRPFLGLFKSKNVTAVDGFSLEVGQGQITCLLGHNGSGKTTCMRMLTGEYNPSSGEAWVRGNHTVLDKDQIRTKLGLCPQHDILYAGLTCMEHLTFFSMLTGKVSCV